MKAERGRMKWESESLPRPQSRSIGSGHLSFAEAILHASDPHSIKRNQIAGTVAARWEPRPISTSYSSFTSLLHPFFTSLFAFLTHVTRIEVSSFASANRSSTRASGTMPLSESNSTQYAVSSSSANPPSILLIDSAVEIGPHCV